ncbi:MAG: glycosyltransferase family 2 protein [Bacteroidetes bacterium]|jgi:cellulose synthase/poly-beta-1,6-N-acetylglucosamine synthase-like glycosyltransferase|nr:glycosyltransferase family 2 protein [Bacteroidota bacterium]MBT7993937.1 glycosyltransferase family 2 protein [Bacteroidota bacterium]
MNIGFVILNILQGLLLSYLILSALYLFVFSLAGTMKYKRTIISSKAQRKFAIIIPGYKEDNVIVNVVTDALKQNYPKNLFDILVIADSFEEQTLEDLKKIDIKLLEINPERSSKAVALKAAFSFLPENYYDFALILDADNMMESDFLRKMNEAFNSSHNVFQAHRTAKNLNTPMSVLDAINEEVNNHIFRKGHRALKFSTPLIGSGMAFKYDLLKSLISESESIFEDKEIDYLLIKYDIYVDYLHDVILWDEKIQDINSFGKQRRRWIASQFQFFTKYFNLGIRSLFIKGDVKTFIKSMEIYLPPRLLLIFTTLIFSVLSIFINPLAIDLLWYSSFALTCITILLAIPKKYFSSKTLKAIFLLPKAFLVMAFSMITFKKAASKWVHTKHTGISGITDETE